MKSYISRISLCAAVAVGLLASSCSDSFDEINRDPNRLEAVPPGSLLAPVLLYGNNAILNRTHRISHELMQYTVQTNLTNEFHRYVFPATEPDYIWRNLYRWASNANDMYKLSVNINDNNNAAVALIVRAWLVSNLTDIFGEIPFSQAFSGTEKIYFPEFDEQQSIYTTLIEDLKQANEMINTSQSLEAATDPLYGGDMMKWKRFCNSLRLRFLIRVSGRPEMNAPDLINEMYSDPAKFPMFTSNDDAAVFKYSGVSPFINPLYELREFDFSGNRAYGTTFINILNKCEDPRREKFATKSKVGEYVGIESGQPSGVVALQLDNGGEGVSRYLPYLQSATQPAYMLTYSEVLFNLAEAAQRGWITADAATLYTNAVIASVEQWGAVATPAFLTNPNVAYNGTFEQLMEQKYIALFFVGFEAWAEYRRTGLPTMFKGTATQNGGILPTRLEYPVITKATNKANTDIAAQRMGGDNMTVRVWWDVD